MKKKKKLEIAVLGALIAVGASILYSYTRPPAQPSRVSTVANYRPIKAENPQIHWSRLEAAQTTEYKASPRDIFNRDLPPPPPKPVHVPGPGDNDYVPPPPPPPPPPPQLPLKYFGEGKGRRAFLTDGDAVYIVAEGDTVLGRYRIIRINHLSLEFEEIGSGRHGTAKLEDEGPAI